MLAFRIAASTVSIIGLCLLALVFVEWQAGTLAGEFFPDTRHTARHNFYGLLLALPVPLHVIFIGLIIQKKWLSPPWARVAWFGITLSGMWLGGSLLFRVL